MRRVMQSIVSIIWIAGAMLVIGNTQVFAGGVSHWQPAEKTVRQPTVSPEYVRGEVIIKFRDSVKECVHCLLKEKNRSFASLKTRFPKSLDPLNQLSQVKFARPLFPQWHDKWIKNSKWKYQRFVNSVRQKFPLRTARAPKDAPLLDLTHWYVFEVDKNADIPSLCRSYQQNPNVEYAMPNYLTEVTEEGIPSDVFFSSQWGLRNEGQTGGSKDADIDAPEAWDIENNASSVVIGIIDTGVNYKHEDISDNLWMNLVEKRGVFGVDDDRNGYVDDLHGYDFYHRDNDPMDGVGHGTMVAGIAGAVGNNSVGISGVAQRCQLMILKKNSDTGAGASAAMLGEAIMYAANNGADVINMSWAFGLEDITISWPIAYAYTLGCILVAAAGNDGSDAILYPASDTERVIAVSATDDKDKRWENASYGLKLDVMAPGVNIYTCNLSGYTAGTGTSFACPHVAGLSALMIAYHPDWTTNRITQAILASVDDIATSGFDIETGMGRINAERALVLNSVIETQIKEPTSGKGFSQGATVTITGTVSRNGLKQYQLYYGNERNPSEWIPIGVAHSDPVTDGLLGSWEIGSLSPDHYLLRLVATSLEEVQFQEVAEVNIEPLNTQITQETVAQTSPAISGDIIVWSDGNDIHGYNITTQTTFPITNDPAVQISPEIAGDWLVWLEPSGQAMNLYLYEMTSGREQLIKTFRYGSLVPPSPDIEGHSIAWVDADQIDDLPAIYVYDINSGGVQTVRTGLISYTPPSISGSRLVWCEERNRNGDFNVYLYELESKKELQITDDPSRQADARIWGERIVWTDSRNGNHDIYLYDISHQKEIQITTHPKEQYSPVIYGDRIVWHDRRNTNKYRDDIYYYDVAKGIEGVITLDRSEQRSADISGNRVVWEDMRNGNSDIYLHEFTTSGVSVTGVVHLQGRENHAGTGILSVYHPGEITPLLTQEIHITPDGKFSTLLTQEDGVYDFGVKVQPCLSRVILGTNVALGNSISLEFPELLTGDVDDSDGVAMADFSWISCFMTNPECTDGDGKQPVQYEDADLNLDGKVDEQDLNLFLTNIGKRGDICTRSGGC